MNLRPAGRRPVKTLIVALALALPIAIPAGASAGAGTNLIVNPGLEALDSSGFPVCWEQSGYGTNNFSFSVTSQAHSGSNAMQVAITSISNGDRKAMMLENPSCAPAVTPGHQYNLCVWYMASTPNVVITTFRHDVSLGWQYWSDLKTLPVTGTYQQACVDTSQVPPNTDQITWGVTVYGVGTLITDDYSMVDDTQPATGNVCTAGAACTQGVWQVMPFNSPVRAIHAVLMYNGDVLLVAGSGNDPNQFAAGTFTSAVYDPRTGSFTQIPTPDDFFCAGHVQLPDGRILILGGNLAYPAADGSHGYEGLNTSYIFNPATNTYQKVNNLNDGHRYDFLARTAGQVTLLFFGYTHCPDECPTTMSNTAVALRDLPSADQARIRVVFVTVDPARDTGPVLRRWLDQFNPDFTGLTGTLQAIQAAADAADIPVGRPVRQPDGSYTLDHGTEMLAFTPDNRAHLAFFPSTFPADMAHDLKLLTTGHHP